MQFPTLLLINPVLIEFSVVMMLFRVARGCVLLAPMCRISDEMRPSAGTFMLLRVMAYLAPTWAITPLPPLIDKYVCVMMIIRIVILYLCGSI